MYAMDTATAMMDKMKQIAVSILENITSCNYVIIFLNIIIFDG